jgi:hypothetical protein
VALTELQRHVCRLLAERRVASGESYVAGGAALGEATGSGRVSQDIDLFHDMAEAVAEGWAGDRSLLERTGAQVTPVRERPSFVEAVVELDGERVLVQWAADSAYRFFPLQEHPDFGLVLHPFDLATNKVLALVGRVEARDWIDVIASHERIQRLGYLAWAACGKDPGFSPAAILDQAARTSRYSHEEIEALAFADARPSARELSRAWHAMLEEAREIVTLLPAEQVGRCVLTRTGELYKGGPEDARGAVERAQIAFRPGSIRGVLPSVNPFD